MVYGLWSMVYGGLNQIRGGGRIVHGGLKLIVPARNGSRVGFNGSWYGMP